MTRQQITIEVDVPDGYEATGEFRPAQPGEPTLYSFCIRQCASENQIILRPLVPQKKLRPYTAYELLDLAMSQVPIRPKSRRDLYRYIRAVTRNGDAILCSEGEPLYRGTCVTADDLLETYEKGDGSPLGVEE